MSFGLSRVLMATVSATALFAGSMAPAQSLPSKPAASPVTRPATTAPATRPAMVIPQTPGTHRVTTSYVTVDGKELKLPFVLFLPQAYREKGQKLPVLVFLHGLGECGTDLDAIFYHGPNFELSRNSAFAHAFPMIVISPQCPPRGQRWDRGNMDEHVNALLDKVLPKLNADEDRVYATGLSMGGLGTWYLARNRPGRYAAIAPVSSLEIDPEGTAGKLKNTAVVAITGEGDGAQIAQSARMVDALRKQGGLAQHVTGPDGHIVWIRAYAQPRTYEWLLLNQRGRSLAMAEIWPTKRGIHAMSAPPTTQPAQRVDYLLRLPSDGMGQRKRTPMIAYFPDPNAFGTFQQKFPLHGPTRFMADLSPGRSLPFIVVQVMLPPFARHTPDDLAAIGRMLTSVAARYNVEQLYVAGSGESASLALQVTRLPEVQAAALVLDVPANTRLDTGSGDAPIPSVVLAVTNQPDGEVHTRLKSLIGRGLEGSELVVHPPDAGEQDAFLYPDLYQRLLSIKPRPR